ncbi:hypothetical protein D0Z07_9237 [Hyphodiscus hymeniophilus]|uniref:Uncharacterized protein n=1 Tax=Hyphodiscus hymeniophilus TaxID=353542 RepID=A0A9P6VDK5_9HELO|nr:hypothetical protein D0Z07_9237 [Hyphodiscus hymeniophilus]
MDGPTSSTIATLSEPSDKPTILLLSLAAEDLFNSRYAHLINSLNERAQLKKAKTTAGAARFLESNTPKAIIITDQGLTQPANQGVIEKVITYVRGGGLAIVGLHFPSHITGPAFKAFFRRFGLPWEPAELTRREVRFNVGCELPSGATPIAVKSYTTKVLHVKNALPREKIIVPVNTSTQVAVAGAKVGDGFVVYAGDVEPGENSNMVLLSLCGL